MPYIKKYKDLNKPTICGIGFVGEGPHKTHENRKNTRTYNLWIAMLHRCYGKVQIIRPTYLKCSVDARWHNYQTFCEDIRKLPGYSYWLIPANKFALDKDIKVKGNCVYSPETCMFVSSSANSKATKRS